MVQKIGPNDPVELGVGVLRGNTLVKAIAVIVGVLLWLGLPVELSDAACDFAAVSDGRPVTPVKAFAHPEFRVESVIHAELDGSSVQEPGLIARGISRHVEGVPGRSG